MGVEKEKTCGEREKPKGKERRARERAGTKKGLDSVKGEGRSARAVWRTTRSI